MSGSITVNVPAKKSAIRAVVIRKDGRVEDLGVVSYWHQNPAMRAGWLVFKALRAAWRRVLPPRARAA